MKNIIKMILVLLISLNPLVADSQNIIEKAISNFDNKFLRDTDFIENVIQLRPNLIYCSNLTDILAHGKSKSSYNVVPFRMIDIKYEKDRFAKTIKANLQYLDPQEISICPKNVQVEILYEMKGRDKGFVAILISGGYTESREILEYNQSEDADRHGKVIPLPKAGKDYLHLSSADVALRVRSLPSEKGKIKFKLREGQFVYVKKRDPRFFKINGKKGNWVFINTLNSGEEGWVFEPYLIKQ